MVAPRNRNSMAKSVLPAPALPQMSVGRPAGRPPPVISSKPGMPVSSFCRPALLFERLRRFGLLKQKAPAGTRVPLVNFLGNNQGGGCREFITHLAFGR